MAKTKTKIKFNLAAFRELRVSAPVQADIDARAQRIASAAGPGYAAGHRGSRNRSRAYVAPVTPKAIASEARNHKLLGALNAGRG